MERNQLVVRDDPATVQSSIVRFFRKKSEEGVTEEFHRVDPFPRALDKKEDGPTSCVNWTQPLIRPTLYIAIPAEEVNNAVQSCVARWTIN